MWILKISSRSFVFGKSKKKISSNRPFRIISKGNKSILLAVEITNTGFVFSESQLIKVARTRLLVPLSPVFSLMLKALVIN